MKHLSRAFRSFSERTTIYMPESSGDAKVRRGGQFYSHVAKQDRCLDLLLTEVQQTTGLKVPNHEHELGYLTVVLGGYYAEDNAEGFIELPPFTAIFNPSGVAHSALIGQKGTRFFTAEFPPELVKRYDVRLPDFPVVDTARGALLWPGLGMFAAFKSGAADPLTLECHLMELFGSLSEPQSAATQPPSWFFRLKDQLHSEFRKSLRIADLAAETGVHPIHVARVFRKYEKQTPGEYLQRLRVRAACRLLSGPETSLAGAAVECGFADQSHLTRVFQKIVGTTPGRFRKTLGT